MINVMIRFLFVYFFMVFSMKLMGKRQVGQMQMSELVTAFFLSELATYTVTERGIPLIQGVFPILAMICLEVVVSFLTIKIPAFKKAFDFSPSALIREGKIQQKELVNSRVTLDELLSLLRLAGYYDLSSVRYAFLEPNGQLSVVPFPDRDQVCCADLGLKGDGGGFSVAVINDGRVNLKALELIGKTENWLMERVRQFGGKEPMDFLILSSDLEGNVLAVKKEGR